MYLPLKRSETIRPPLLAIRSGHTIRTVESPSVLSGILITTTTTTLEPDPFDKSIQPEEPTLSRKESKKKKEKEEVAPGIRQMARQRARIHRQLRLIFIYPLVYTLMWVLPFVQHCMM
jgi:G protein-coupled receptor GPR1